ncbi:MAG: prepilin-type N-terminal cleavage/methylation domain-containing protein [Syntrophomonadaceae bacterium]
MAEQKQLLKNERGMTLMEVLVSLIILGLVISVLVPLSVMIAKNMRDNRARLSASQIAAAVIEKEIAATTPENYSGRATGYTVTQEIMNGITFTVETDIEWKDDPADDDASGNDLMPFDYKTIQVTVSAPGAFSGTVTKFADYRTYITREGGEDPFAGIEVTVERGWDKSPVKGAVVTLTPVAGGASYTVTTDDKGIALQPLEFTEETEDYKVAVEETPSLIMLPDPDNKNTVTATQWFTQKITIDMEEPFSLTMNFTGQHSGGQVVLDCPSRTKIEGYDYTRQIATGQSSVTFSGLWPVGSDGTNGWPGKYTAKLNLKVYEQDFSKDNGGYTLWQEQSQSADDIIQNIWMHNGGSWYASKNNYPGASYYPEGQNRLVSPLPLIDFSGYYPQSGFTLTGSLTWQQSISNDLNNLPGLVYKSRDQAAPDSSSGTWLCILNSSADGSSQQKTDLETADMTNNLRLLFDASPAMAYYQIDWVTLECVYTKAIECSEPGETLNFNVTP